MISDSDEVNLKIRKYPHAWKLRDTFFNNRGIKEETLMKSEIKYECYDTPKNLHLKTWEL